MTVLGVFDPGDHGSTFGGNPLACAVARTAMKVLVEEDMIGNSARMGEFIRNEILAFGSPFVKEVRGRGLMLGIVLQEDAGGAQEFCERLRTGDYSVTKHRKMSSGSRRHWF